MRWSRGLKWLGAAVLVGAGLIALAVAWAALTGQGLLQSPATPYPPLAASTDPEVIARGDYIVHGPGHCAMCHSTDDRRGFAKVLTEPLHGGLPFEMGPIGTRYAANLTPDPQTGIGGRSDAEIARVLRYGVLPDGEVSIFMAYSVGYLSDEDIVAVLSYLRSLPPVRKEVPRGHYGLLAKVMLRFGMFQLAPRAGDAPRHVPPADEPSVERGEYLAVSAAFCKSCHTASDMTTFQSVGPAFAGGTPEASHDPSDADMEFAPPNLTSSAVGYTGRVTEDAFVARFRAGRAIPTSIMPWEPFSTMTDADLRSIYRYLLTVPKVEADSGPGYRKLGSFTPGS